MNTMTAPRLAALRKEMKAKGISACIIPSADCHLSEYINDHFKLRAYYSGFTGSAGTLFVASERSYLITDGRYFLQAERQLEGSEIKLVRMGEPGEPDIFELCRRELDRGDTLFVDGKLITEAFAEKLRNLTASIGVKLSLADAPTGDAERELAPQSFNKIQRLPDSITGQTLTQKLSMLRDRMRALGAEAHIIISLEEIAWLLNLRSSDIKNTPVFYAYMYVTLDDATVYLDAKAANDVVDYLAENGVKVLDYNSFYDRLEYIDLVHILYDKEAINAAVVSRIPPYCRHICATDPILLAKAVKNETEIENLKRVHIHDGLAVARFMHHIKNARDSEYTEISATEKLREFRKLSPLYLGDSFDTICAYGANAAVVHYSATPESDTILRKKEALLVDSGGQYEGGTTDITRVFALGEPTDEFKLHYTTVLKSMLRLQSTQFPHGVRCAVLDFAAREPVWKLGLDYRHGTGHGVGYMLSVHEGPNRFHYANNAPALECGMVTSDEPGLYIAGKHGIRIENEILCVRASSGEYGEFLKFEPLTLCPIDLDAVLPELLDRSELDALNDYHRLVYDMLSPLADKDELIWLAEYTRAI